MLKKLLFVILALLLISMVSAGPYRDITINVVDVSGVGVEDANVSMHVIDNEYFTFDNLTDSDGVVVFHVDLRISVPNNIPMIDGVGPGVEVPIKDTEVSDYVVVDSNEVHSVDWIDDKISTSDSERWYIYRPYPNRTFYFNITPTSGSINFIPTTYVRNFNLGTNKEFEFIVGDEVPIINLPSDIVVNEEANIIVLDLEEFILDFDTDFEDLDIVLENSNWNTVNCDIGIVNNELVIDFFPSLDLVYHTDNSVTFTISVDDGENYVEETYTYYYEVDYNAVKGIVTDLYDQIDITDFDISVNGVDNILVDSNEFIAFFNLDEAPELNISSDGYYDSLKYINLVGNEDFELDANLIQIIYDATYGGDYLMDGFTRVFRYGYPNGGVTRWVEQPIFCVDTDDTAGYFFNPTDIAMIETTLEYMPEFTNDLMTPFDGEHLIYADDGTCNPLLNGQLGYVTIQKEDLPGAGGHHENHTENGFAVIAAQVVFDPSFGQATSNQELFQSTGGSFDIDPEFLTNFGVTFWPPGESTFCDDICYTPTTPTDIDMNFGKFAYSRVPGNLAPDIDFEIIYGGSDSNEYTEVVQVFTALDRRGREQRYYIKKGYALANQHITSWDEVLDELPKGAVLTKKDYGDAKEVKQKKNVKINSNLRSKLRKLFI